MKHELLLEKYLAGRLDAAEQEYFDRLVAESPEFAGEVQALVRIEHTLQNTQYAELDSYEPFLKSTEEQLLSRFKNAPQTPAVSGGFSPFLKTFLGIAAAGFVGIFGWFFIENSFKNTPENSFKNETNVENIQPEFTQQAAVHAEPESNKPQLLKTEISQEKVVNAQAQTPDTTARAQANADLKTTASNGEHERQLAAFKKQLSEAEAKGDNIAQALYLHKLGTAYRLQNQPENARQYLHAASEKARSIRLFETEAAALGELGLVEARAGNVLKSEEYFKNAVAVLKVNGKDAGKWEGEVEKLKR